MNAADPVVRDAVGGAVDALGYRIISIVVTKNGASKIVATVCGINTVRVINPVNKGVKQEASQRVDRNVGAAQTRRVGLGLQEQVGRLRLGVRIEDKTNTENCKQGQKRQHDHEDDSAPIGGSRVC